MKKYVSILIITMTFFSSCSLFYKESNEVENSYEFNIPNLKWHLEIFNQGFKELVNYSEINDDSYERFIFIINEKDSINLACGIYKYETFNNKCDNFFNNYLNQDVLIKNLKKYQFKDFNIKEFFLVKGKDQKINYNYQIINQQNIIMSLFRDGVCIYIRISKMNYNSQDRPKFDSIMQRIRIVEKVF
jgi:hypothetical protein